MNNQRVVWFYYSLIGSTTAYFVLLYDQKEKVDTIVKSTNIKDVNFSKNTVTLLLRGKPEIYDDPIILKKKVNGLNIKVDTTAVSTGPTFRKFYKRNNEGKLY